MSSSWEKQNSSRLGRTLVGTLSSATALTTTFGSQVRQVRVITTLPIWARLAQVLLLRQIVRQHTLACEFSRVFFV